MIRKIWLQQPLAFARAGASPEPLAAFGWTTPDLRPHVGTGRTGITPGGVQFRDEKGIRPVWPYFELHGEWDEPQPGGGALTLGVLEANGRSLRDITWSIRHANLKAYAYTRAEGDRVEVEPFSVKGDSYETKEL